MMQGFYLLAMQQARRRTLLAALACIAALVSIVLAGRALLSAPAVPELQPDVRPAIWARMGGAHTRKRHCRGKHPADRIT